MTQTKEILQKNDGFFIPMLRNSEILCNFVVSKRYYLLKK